MTKYILIILIFNSLLFSKESDQNDYTNLSLDELMNVKVTTAGYQKSTWREQPGIITIFTSNDIQSMGAITLRDILIHTPGVSLGMDNHNAVSLMFRGSWTLEGKILYVINDMPVNDMIYGTYTISPNFPADIIDRVEILRGPGSAKYGGNAQIAVIRIYTKNSKNEPQISLSGYNQSPNTNSGLITYNDQFNLGNTTINLATGINRGKWGTGNWIDAKGKIVDISNNNVSGENLALNAKWEKLKYQLYYENYDMAGNQGFGIYLPGEKVRFLHLNQSLSNEFKIDENWSLTPRIGFRNESTWRSEGHSDSGHIYDIRALKADLSLEATNNYSENGSITLGISDEEQKGYVVKVVSNGVDQTNLILPPNGYAYYNLAALYGTWNFKISDFEFNIGTRIVNHTYAGFSITPKLGFTICKEEWHLKALYGNAFREPNIEQIDNNSAFFKSIPPLKPEKTSVCEIEYGHSIDKNSYLTGTLFYQYLHNPIIYTPQGFTNNVPSKTFGIELQYVYHSKYMNINANYSKTYANDNDIPLYDVSGVSGQYFGAATDIANIWTSWDIGIENMNLLFSLRYLGVRYANAFDPLLLGGSNLPISQQKLNPELTLNLGLAYDFSPFRASFNIQNITDTKQYIPQPYNDISTPFPYGSREIRFQIKWKFKN